MIIILNNKSVTECMSLTNGNHKDLRGAETREAIFKDNRTTSASLFSGLKELTIVHNCEEYKLKITGNGKLILTK